MKPKASVPKRRASVTRVGGIAVACLLLSVAARAQPPNDVGANLNSSVGAIVQLIDQTTGTPVPNADIVSISPLPDPVNGGHVTGHTPQRTPEYMGTVSPTSCNTGPDANQCVVTFNALNIGGKVRFHLRYQSSGGIAQTDTPNGISISAVNGYELTLLDGLGSSYALVGDTTQHPFNHFCQSDFCSTLVTLADSYSLTWNVILAYNDASLLKGGIFDINYNWIPPHAEHQDGREVDVRANGGQWSIPFDDTIRAWFVQKVIDLFGQGPLLEDVGTSNEHYHVRG
jgi:hypothetical protein